MNESPWYKSPLIGQAIGLALGLALALLYAATGIKPTPIPQQAPVVLVINAGEPVHALPPVPVTGK